MMKQNTKAVVDTVMRLVNKRAITAQRAWELLASYDKERDLNDLIAGILASDINSDEYGAVDEVVETLDRLQRAGE